MQAGHLLFAGLLLAGCGEPPDPAESRPALPGVDPELLRAAPLGEREWFWRDVLATPLSPDDPAPDTALLALPDPIERLDGLLRLAGQLKEPAGAGGAGSSGAGETAGPVAPNAVSTLMAALRDPEVGVAIVAAQILGGLRAEEAIPRLLDGIGPYPTDYDVPPEVRMAEASALARMGHPGGVPLLLMALAENSDLEVSEQALEWPRSDRVAFLQELALPGVVALAGTDFGFRPYPSPAPLREEAVRRARAWWEQQRVALWQAAPLRDARHVARVRLLVAYLDAYQLRQIDDARFILSNQGPGALPYLREGLASRNDYLRLHGLEILERMTAYADSKLRVQIAGAAAPLLLADPVSGVAAQAASVIGAAGVADQLIVALEQRAEADVRVAIVAALGRSGRPEALPPLRRLLEELRPASSAAPPSPPDPSAGPPDRPAFPPDLAAALHAALLSLDPAHPVDDFLALLDSSDTATSFAALRSLRQLLGSDAGFDPLLTGQARRDALAAVRTALTQRTEN
ncbi:MAG: HEAT repeat domain-containing protein [Planctomycetota bacterium]